MSLLSILGKIGKGALGVVPGGGTLSTVLDVASGVGGALGAGASNAKGGRMADADLQARMDALNNRTALDAAQHNMTAGSNRLGQVQRADFAGNMKDAAPTGDPRIDKFGGGGLRPSTLGPDSATAANAQKRQALAALMSGSDQVHPTVSQIPEAGLLEKIGGIGGLAGGLAGLARPLLAGGGAPVMYGQTGQPTGAPNLGYQPLKKAALLEDPTQFNAGGF